ncbi:MAG: aspartate carbamoyltransferase [Patescibacteria group bacterium]
MNHILTGGQFADKKLLEKIFKRAEGFEKGKVSKLLEDKVVATLFYEPSTRTRLSFESAAVRLGASIISTENASANSSAFKGETIEDTIRVVESYADIIVMRHPEKGSAERAAKVSSVPIINAGDGAHEHPTQAMYDAYTIKKEMGHLDKLTIAFVGDLLYGRTVHSLLPMLSMYEGNNFIFVSPKELALPEEFKKELKEKNISFSETQNLEDALKNADVIYMTRVQKERFSNIEDYNKVKDLCLLKPEHLKLMKAKSAIMHPLPRVNEIDSALDSDPRAAYFRQAKNGLYVRMALLCYALGL